MEPENQDQSQAKRRTSLRDSTTNTTLNEHEEHVISDLKVDETSLDNATKHTPTDNSITVQDTQTKPTKPAAKSKGSKSSERTFPNERSKLYDYWNTEESLELYGKRQTRQTRKTRRTEAEAAANRQQNIVILETPAAAVTIPERQAPEASVNTTTSNENIQPLYGNEPSEVIESHVGTPIDKFNGVSTPVDILSTQSSIIDIVEITSSNQSNSEMVTDQPQGTVEFNNSRIFDPVRDLCHDHRIEDYVAPVSKEDAMKVDTPMETQEPIRVQDPSGFQHVLATVPGITWEANTSNAVNDNYMNINRIHKRKAPDSILEEDQLKKLKQDSSISVSNVISSVSSSYHDTAFETPKLFLQDEINMPETQSIAEAKPKAASKSRAAPKPRAASKPKAAPKAKSAPKAKAAPKPKAPPKPKAAPKPKAPPKPKAAPKPKAPTRSRAKKQLPPVVDDQIILDASTSALNPGSITSENTTTTTDAIATTINTIPATVNTSNATEANPADVNSMASNTMAPRAITPVLIASRAGTPVPIAPMPVTRYEFPQYITNPYAIAPYEIRPNVTYPYPIASNGATPYTMTPTVTADTTTASNVTADITIAPNAAAPIAFAADTTTGITTASNATIPNTTAEIATTSNTTADNTIVTEAIAVLELPEVVNPPKKTPRKRKLSGKAAQDLVQDETLPLENDASKQTQQPADTSSTTKIRAIRKPKPRKAVQPAQPLDANMETSVAANTANEPVAQSAEWMVEASDKSTLNDNRRPLAKRPRTSKKAQQVGDVDSIAEEAVPSDTTTTPTGLGNQVAQVPVKPKRRAPAKKKDQRTTGTGSTVEEAAPGENVPMDIEPAAGLVEQVPAKPKSTPRRRPPPKKKAAEVNGMDSAVPDENAEKLAPIPAKPKSTSRRRPTPKKKDQGVIDTDSAVPGENTTTNEQETQVPAKSKAAASRLARVRTPRVRKKAQEDLVAPGDNLIATEESVTKGQAKPKPAKRSRATKKTQEDLANDIVMEEADQVDGITKAEGSTTKKTTKKPTKSKPAAPRRPPAKKSRVNKKTAADTDAVMEDAVVDDSMQDVAPKAPRGRRPSAKKPVAKKKVDEALTDDIIIEVEAKQAATKARRPPAKKSPAKKKAKKDQDFTMEEYDKKKTKKATLPSERKPARGARNSKKQVVYDEEDDEEDDELLDVADADEEMQPREPVTIEHVLENQNSFLGTADMKALIPRLLQALPESEKAELAKLLPDTDVAVEGSSRTIHPEFSSASNNFFWEAAGKWQEVLMLGGFDSEKKRRMEELRAEKVDDSFKDDNYEAYWGERMERHRKDLEAKEKASKPRGKGRGRGRAAKE